STLCFFYHDLHTLSLYSLSYTTLFRSYFHIVSPFFQLRGVTNSDKHIALILPVRATRELPSPAEEEAATDGMTEEEPMMDERTPDRKSTRLNSSHQIISYAVFCLKKQN